MVNERVGDLRFHFSKHLFIVGLLILLPLVLVSIAFVSFSFPVPLMLVVVIFVVGHDGRIVLDSPGGDRDQ